MSDWGRNVQFALAALIGTVGTLATIAILVKGPNSEVVQQQMKTTELDIQKEKTKQIALQNPGSSVGLLGAKGAPLPDRQEPVVAIPAQPTRTAADLPAQFPCGNAEELRIGLQNNPAKYLEGGGRTYDFDETGCSHVRLSGIAAYAAQNYQIFLADDPQTSCGDLIGQTCVMGVGGFFDQGKPLVIKVVGGSFRVVPR